MDLRPFEIRPARCWIFNGKTTLYLITLESSGGERDSKIFIRTYPYLEERGSKDILTYQGNFQPRITAPLNEVSTSDLQEQRKTPVAG